jgi:hypothetical protein
MGARRNGLCLARLHPTSQSPSSSRPVPIHTTCFCLSSSSLDFVIVSIKHTRILPYARFSACGSVKSGGYFPQSHSMFQTRSNSFLCRGAKKAAARYGVTENSFSFFSSAFTLGFLIWFDLVRHGDRRPSSPNGDGRRSRFPLRKGEKGICTRVVYENIISNIF